MFKVDGEVVRNSVLLFLGPAELYDSSAFHNDYDLVFHRSGLKSRVFVKTMRLKMEQLGLNFDEFVNYCVEIFTSLMVHYPFTERGEKLGVADLGDSGAVSLTIPPSPVVGGLAGLGSGFDGEPSAVAVFTSDSLFECDSRGNFFTEVLANILNVPLNVREHLLNVAPNFASLPKVFIEMWLFLKHSQHDWSDHDGVECEVLVAGFNTNVDKALTEFNNVELLSKETLQRVISGGRVEEYSPDFEVYSSYSRGGFIRVNRNMMKVGVEANRDVFVKHFSGNLNIINVETMLLLSLYLNVSCRARVEQPADVVLASDVMFNMLSYNKKYHPDVKQFSPVAGKIVDEDFENFFHKTMFSLQNVFQRETGVAVSHEAGGDDMIVVNSFNEMLNVLESSIKGDDLMLIKDLPEEWIQKI